MGPRINNTNSQKCITSLAKRSKSIIHSKTTIMQLPTEILSKILEDVPLQHYCGIRSTCKKLKEATDYHLRHRFLRALHLNDAKKSAEIITACDSGILKLGKELLEVCEMKSYLLINFMLTYIFHDLIRPFIKLRYPTSKVACNHCSRPAL